MITPVKSYSFNNMSFGSNEQTETPTQQAQSAPVEKPQKPTVTERAGNIRQGFLNFLKSVNNVKDTGAGAVRGAAEGVAATAVIGLIGKSIKSADGKIVGTLGNIVKGTASAAWSFVKFIPAIIKDNTPLQTVKTVLHQPAHFYKDYMKGNDLAATIATLAGIGVLAFRTLQGKMNANKANAEIDHYTTHGGHKS